MKNLLIGCMAVVMALATFSGCEQDKAVYSEDNYLMFSDTLYTYAVQETNEIFKVPVSATVSANYDRTFAVEVVERESNAIEGKHYRILSNTLTIKAGERSADIEVQGVYENIEITDSLGFALRLIIPDAEQWGMYEYGTETKVVMQKVCPFDVKNFTGYCKITSTYFSSDYCPKKVDLRLVTSDVVKDKGNTVAIHGLYFDGYDTEITFNRKDVLKPSLEMEEQVCATTGEVFNTIHGDGKLRISQPAAYSSFYNTNEDYVLQYVTLSVNNRDGSLYGTVGTFVNVIEWIDEAEAEKLKEQGY